MEKMQSNALINGHAVIMGSNSKTEEKIEGAKRNHVR